MIIKKTDENSADKAAEILKKGGIVILPTDTVYGFSGIVEEASACGDGAITPNTIPTDAKIRAIKGR